MNDQPARKADQQPSLLEVFARGALLVTAVALNVSQVASGQVVHAFVTGTLVSLLWWGNAGRANSRKGLGAALAYGLGAGCGTVAGILLGRAIG